MPFIIQYLSALYCTLCKITTNKLSDYLLVKAHVNEHWQRIVPIVRPKEVLRLLSQACGMPGILARAMAGVHAMLQAAHHTSVHDDGLQAPCHTDGLLHLHSQLTLYHI